MAKQKPPEKNVMDVREGEAIVLVGQPGAMRGEFHLQNPGDERVVFRGAEVHGLAAPKVTRAAKAAEAQPPTVPLSQKLPAVVVRPGERRRVPVKFALSPTTPPGEYHAEIQLAEHTWPVVMHVTEKLALEISPSRLVLHNNPGATVTRQVILSNLGNVPITIEELAAIPLDDELLQCRLLRAVVAAIGDDEDQTIDSILTQFAHQGKSILAQAGLLRVRNRTGRLTLEPGQISPVELEFRLPSTIDKRTRYRALVPIFTSDLEVIIAPAFDVLTPEKPEKPEKTPPAKPAAPVKSPRGKATRTRTK
jgi:hypothetical protein